MVVGYGWCNLGLVVRAVKYARTRTRVIPYTIGERRDVKGQQCALWRRNGPGREPLFSVLGTVWVKCKVSTGIGWNDAGRSEDTHTS